MKVVIASDHAGFKLKERIKQYLKRKNLEILDMGTDSLDSVDYPDFAIKVAEKVAGDKNLRGILICGTGTGMTIVANKVRGVRAEQLMMRIQRKCRESIMIRMFWD